MIKTVTAESVTAGHPDKFCDLVSDAVLDECLRQDEKARVACEVYATKGLVVIGGQISTTADIDYKAVVNRVAQKVGYDIKGYELFIGINEQSQDIAGAVTLEGQGAGDQGIMVGYATDETETLMPFCYEYARRLTERLTKAREDGTISDIGSDGKAQVSAEFENRKLKAVTSIVVSIQHLDTKDTEQLKAEILEKVIKPTFDGVDITAAEIHINPSGRFVVGGIKADTGLTGRKLCVDAYGASVRVGGGAYSGKDATKVDRSAAYMARHIAKTIVASGTAKECEVELAYAIGIAEPLAVNINTFGTAKKGVSDETIKAAVLKTFNLTPKAITEYLDLNRPIYEATASGGHYGRDEFPWEQVDKAALNFKKMLKITQLN